MEKEKSTEEALSDFECIRRESPKYPGEWIAVKRGKVLGHAKTRRLLQAELEERGLLNNSLFFKVS